MWREFPCTRCSDGRTGIGGRIDCPFCRRTGVARLVRALRGYVLDVSVPKPGGGWRVRLVGARRIDVESMDLTWHRLGDDLRLGRSRDSWRELDVAKGVAEVLAGELWKRAGR